MVCNLIKIPSGIRRIVRNVRKRIQDLITRPPPQNVQLNVQFNVLHVDKVQVNVHVEQVEREQNDALYNPAGPSVHPENQSDLALYNPAGPPVHPENQGDLDHFHYFEDPQ